MRKRKGSFLQRMLAVLLAAVLVTGMVSNAAPASVLAQEAQPPGGQQESTDKSAFAPLAEEIKAQTVPVGTALEALSLPEELPEIAVTVEDDTHVMKRAAVLLQAAETHKHPVCGENCGHSGETHTNVEWTALTQNGITGNSDTITINGKTYDCYNLSAGNYYLTENISIDKILKTSGAVNLCFNGHTITSTLKDTNNNIGSLIARGNFNACDCGSGGGFTNSGQYVLLSNGTTNLYGGKFSGGCAVHVYGGTFTLDGATLEATGAAVDVQSISKAFIKSGSVTSSGSFSVDIFTTNFTMSGGTVTNTKYNGTALHFSYDKAGTITGGTITASGSSGKGVQILNGASVTLSGSPTINGGGGDILVGGNSKITADSLTVKYGISYAFATSNITEAAPVTFTVVAPNDYSGYFAASNVLEKSGLALRKSDGGSGNEQTVEIYRPHKITYCAEVPATCTADGTGEYWKCTNKDCGKMFSDADGKTEITSIPVKGALGHNKEGSVVHKDATCTEAGVKGGIYCTRCDDGKSEAETVIPANGHTSDSGKVTTAPTCTEKGTKTYTCMVCKTVLDTEEIDATGHDYSWTITKTPTVTAEGTAVGVCGNDSSHEETKILPVLTDTTVWTVGDKVEPTKDKDGSQIYTSEYGTVTVTLPSYAKIAAVAKKIVEEALEGITATNNTTKESVQSAIDAALDEAKKTNADIAGVTVTVGELTKTEATESAAGSIKGSIAIFCGEGTDKATDSVPIDKPIAQLTAGKYTVTVNNGTGGGEYEAGATVTITANAAASGKQFVKWEVNSTSVTLANATSSTTTFTMPAGAVSVTATYKDIAEGHTHNYGQWQHDDTQHWKVCSCGEETGRGNHDFESWITDQEATAIEAGTKHRECQTCGYRQTETIPATGTEPGNGNVTPEVKPGANAPATNISTPTEELKDMLLTDEEKQQVQNGTNIRIVLEVQDAGNTVSDSDKAAVQQALNGFTVGQYLNIDLYKLVGAERTDIAETAKKIRIVITVPDSLKNADSSKTRTFAVIRLHDGRAELLTDLDDSADTIIIETDRFSTYAIVYNDTASSGGGNSGNNDNNNSGNDNGGNANNNSGNDNGGNANNNSSQNNSDKNDTKPDSTKDNEPKTGDTVPLELYATLAMIAGFAYLRLYFTDPKRGMTEETKKELVAGIVGWAKRGGRIRKCLALAAVFVLLVYYHSIGKRTCAEWKEIYGE